MSPLADAFHESFDIWFTEVFGKLKLGQNMFLWFLEVFLFFVLMGSTNAPITLTSIVEAI